MAVDQAEKLPSKEKVPNRASKLSGIIRILAIFSPIFLFTLSILSGLVFWVTTLPLFAWISLGLAVFASILAVIFAFMVVKP